MNTGVATVPWRVRSSPTRARHSSDLWYIRNSTEAQYLWVNGVQQIPGHGISAAGPLSQIQYPQMNLMHGEHEGHEEAGAKVVFFMAFMVKFRSLQPRKTVDFQSRMSESQ
jgi:hypothetical protein